MSQGIAKRANEVLLKLGELFGLVGQSVHSLARIAGTGACRYARDPDANSGKVVILCSGPSLNDSLREVQMVDSDEITLVSVNDFYRNECFIQLRPALHVIADPVYWDDLSFQDHAGPLVDTLKTLSWRPKLCLPYLARGSRLHQALTEGIDYSFFPTAQIKGFAVLERAAFSRGFGMPAAQNVLVAAIAICIWEGYREIAIVGADHSWHQEIVLGEDNILMVQGNHSYGMSPGFRPFVKPSSVWKLRTGEAVSRSDVFSAREIFLAWARVHESYETLGALSRSLGVEIWNCSSTTFIDAFKRDSLKSFLLGRKSV